MSTNVVPFDVYGETEILTSAATYQSDGLAVMADLLGLNLGLISLPSASSNNLLPLFHFISMGIASLNESSASGMTNLLETMSPSGFTCTYNTGKVWNETPSTVSFGNFLYDPNSGNLTLACVSPDVLAIAAYDPSMLNLDSSNILGRYYGKQILSHKAHRAVG